MVGRLTLDQVVKVRILAPQPLEARFGSGLSRLSGVRRGNGVGGLKPACNPKPPREPRERCITFAGALVRPKNASALLDEPADGASAAVR
jgi:hypothetical protein